MQLKMCTNSLKLAWRRLEAISSILLDLSKKRRLSTHQFCLWIWNTVKTFRDMSFSYVTVCMLNPLEKGEFMYREIHAVFHQRNQHISASRTNRMWNKTYLSSLRKPWMYCFDSSVGFERMIFHGFTYFKLLPLCRSSFYFVQYLNLALSKDWVLKLQVPVCEHGMPCL